MASRYGMARSVHRLAALLAVLALATAACGGTDHEPAGERRRRRERRAHRPPRARRPASVVEIRWFCCLGGGDAPEQVEVENAVAEAFNAAHPNIHLTFEAVPYAGARDALATMIGSGNGPDIVGPVGIGGAEAFHGQWLDLQPLIDSTGYDMSQFPEATVSLYNVGGEGQGGIPFAVYPSVLFYQKDLFEEAGLDEPPHEWGGKYTMPDGTEVDWDYDAAREIAMLLTVDENGLDATQDGFDPDNIVQWGFEPQRDDLRQTGAYWKAGALMADDGTTVQIPEAWVAGWKWFYDGMWTDHFAMTGPVFESVDFNPSDYPFFTGQRRHEPELPVVDLRRGRLGRGLGHGRIAVVRRPDHGRVQRGHVPDPQGHQEPGGGVRGPDLPPRRRVGRAAQHVRRHARPPGGAGRLLRERRRELPAGDRLERRQGRRQLRRRAELRVVHAGVQRVARPDRDVRDQVADHARVSTSMPRPRTCGRSSRPSGTASNPHSNDRGAPARAVASSPACRGWPGDARAGAMSSSRRGSSGFSRSR